MPAAARVLQCFTAAAVALYLASTLFRPRNTYSPFFDSWVGNLAYGGAAALCLWRAVSIRRHRAAWLAIGGALTLFAVGAILWTTTVQFWKPVPYPSPSDAAFLAFYPVAYLGIGLLIRQRLPRGSGVWLDGLIAASGFSAIVAALVLGPISQHSTGNTAAVLTNMAYPLGDLVLVTMLVGYFAVCGWRVDRMWWALGGGFALFAFADSLYVWRVVGGTYVTGTPLDGLWPIATLAIASVAWRVHERSATQVVSQPIVVPALFLMGSLSLILYATFNHVLPIALVLATLTLLLTIAKTAGSYRQLRQLAESQRQARTDDLTGLANRRPFYESVARWEADPSGAVGVLMLDLARFKAINDSLGHHVGDEVLRQLGHRLRSTLRDVDTIARLGGDEFGVVVLPLSHPGAAVEMALRVHDILNEPFVVDRATVRVDAAIGIAIGPEHAEDTDTLIHHADVAMFEAKRRHLPWAIYQREWDVDSAARLQLVEELRDAVERQQLTVHYQPKLDLATRRVSGVEALVRWDHPTRGLLTADRFVELAEQTGLLTPLTHAVLSAGVRDLARWRAGGHPITLAINLSVSNLFDDELPRAVERVLHEARVPASALVFEITEHGLMFDRDAAGSVLDRLRALGCELSIDDYGTGFSALSYLRDLPVSELKLDRSFLADATADERARSIVESTVELAHALGLRMVAEGVESAADLELLGALGCDHAQGYHIARPMPAAALTAYLSADARDEPAA